MPTKRNFRKRRGKKGPRRYNRRKRNDYTTVIHRGQGFISPRMITRMKYSDAIAVTLAAGTTSDTLYRLNSVFDPQASLGGHQPYGFDTLAGIYQRYRVFATKWVITFPSTGNVLQVCVLPANSNAPLSNYTLASENPRAITKAVSAGQNPTVFKGKIYLPKLGGDKRVEYKTDDRFSASISTDPLEEMGLHIVMYNPTAGSVTSFFQITLLYMVEFYDPYIVAQS